MGDYGYGNDGYNSKPRENYMRKEVDIDELWNNNIHSGINFAKYESIKVNVDGENKPEPIAKFSEAGFCGLLASNVKRAKYETPTPVQKNALPIIMAGRDLMACAQTGSGKTAAFLLPMINKMIETKADGKTNGWRKSIATGHYYYPHQGAGYPDS